MSADIDARISSFEQQVDGREVTNEDTLEDYVRWIKRFEKWNTEDEPDEITLREFDRWLATNPSFDWNMTRPIDNDEERSGYAYRTRIKALSALKLWLKVEYRQEVPTKVQNIALGEAPDHDPEWLSVGDVEQVIDNADDACDCDDCQTLLEVGYDAIMRAAEICEVRMEDVDLENGIIYVKAKKGSKNASIGLSDDAHFALERHISKHPDRDYLFKNSYGRKWKPKALSTHFIRKHHEVGIHSFTRHSAIIHRLNDGQELGEVSRRARHRNISTTMIYARLVGADIPQWAKEQTGGE